MLSKNAENLVKVIKNTYCENHGKNYFDAGFKLGYLTAKDESMAEIEKLIKNYSKHCYCGYFEAKSPCAVCLNIKAYRQSLQKDEVE